MSAPHDRPDAIELVEAVREWITRSLVEGAIEPNAFHARVAVNMLAIAEREIEHGPAHEAAHRERLASLGFPDDAALATAIRAGDVDEREAEVREAVWASVRDKLVVANPKYLAQRPPGSETGAARL